MMFRGPFNEIRTRGDNDGWRSRVLERVTRVFLITFDPINIRSDFQRVL